MKNKTFKKGIVILLAILMIFGLFVPSAIAVEDATIAPLSVLSAPAPVNVIFPDPALAAGVALELSEVLGTPVTVTTVVTQDDLDLLDIVGSSHWMANHGIVNLEGLQFLRNLGLLAVGSNPITDISPIAGLTNLHTLYLDDTLVTDLSPLTGLGSLNWLWARDSEISDLSPLANLSNLEALIMHGSRVSDISPLFGHPNLNNSLNLGGQQIILPPVQLTNPLVIANDVFFLDGSPITPTSISNNGTYTASSATVTWTGLSHTTTEVSYTFSVTFPISPWDNAIFSGTVTQPILPTLVTGVSIPGGNFQLNTSATRQLTATVLPTTATNQAVTWASDNTAVATVTANGLVQGVSAGTATITVTTVCGNFTASVTVTVVAAPPWQPPNNGGGGGGSTPPTEPDPEPEYRFLDVNSGHWFYDAAMFVYEQGIMQGTSGTNFAPNATLSRGMVATILHRLEGEPASTANHGFGDVAAGTWYANAVAWAFENGIVQGVSATSFAPHAPITREQFATMLHRYAEFAGVYTSVSAGANLNHFADVHYISGWAEDAKLWANYNDLITGRTATTIVPGGTASRAEAATILMRFIQTF